MYCDYLFFIKELLPKIFGKKKAFFAFVKTYGCQQNFADSEKICGILKDAGFGFTKDESKADLIVFNTCAIREHAENRFIGNLGNVKRLKNKNKNLVTVVCGCISQKAEIFEKIKNTFPFVNLVLGTDYFGVFPELLYKVLTTKETVYFNQLGNSSICENVPVERVNRIKASVPIMYGCDNFCSYCVVPYVRGRERSRKSEKILIEVENLIKKGYREITLLGQNVNSYGKGLIEKINFTGLLKKIDEIPGKYWVRFMTSHPKDITKELVDFIANSKHISQYIHLPVQSGNNRILKNMNRKYTREQYLEMVNYIKSRIPGVCLSTDIIVGFPGETEQEFLETVDLVKEVKYFLIYNFVFSKREGTVAAKIPDPVLYEEKVKRLNYLIKVQKSITDELFPKFVGTIQNVLVEKKSEDPGIFLARNSGNILVKIVSNKENILGEFVNVKIISCKRTYLVGEVL